MVSTADLFNCCHPDNQGKKQNLANLKGGYTEPGTFSRYKIIPSVEMKTCCLNHFNISLFDCNSNLDQLFRNKYISVVNSQASPK